MRALLAIALVGVALTGCSTASQQALLTDLKGCERHYNGVVAAGALAAPSFSGSVKIDCPTAAPVSADAKPVT